MNTKQRTLSPLDKLAILEDCLTAEGQLGKAQRVALVLMELKPIVSAHAELLALVKEWVEKRKPIPSPLAEGSYMDRALKAIAKAGRVNQ